MHPPDNHPAWKIAAVVGISLGLVCYLDYVSGYQLTISLFYLVPILLCGWHCRQPVVVGTAFLIGMCYWFTDKDGSARTFHGWLVGAQNLTDAKWQADSTDAEIIHAIKTGPRVMPAFGKKLSPSEIQALAKYVRSFAPGS